jgi:hypothetical protein
MCDRRFYAVMVPAYKRAKVGKDTAANASKSLKHLLYPPGTMGF